MKKILFIFVLMFSFALCVDAEESIEVYNSNEVIKTIDKIYNEDKIDQYSITYSLETYENLDFEKIKNYYKENYMVDLNQNMYKYKDYGLLRKERFMFQYDSSEIYIDNSGIRITDSEKKEVENKIDNFLKPIKNLSDYEKIYNVYKYLSSNIEYDSDGYYDNSLDSNTSVYDVLINRKGTCIGASVTFQYLMEKLGIESYIVDVLHVDESNESFYSTHTYNVVKLNNVWYIVDDYFEGNGLLKKGNNNKYYYSINLSNEDYNIKNMELKLEGSFNDSLNNNSEMESIVFVLIMIILFLIIKMFTRRKK